MEEGKFQYKKGTCLQQPQHCPLHKIRVARSYCLLAILKSELDVLCHICTSMQQWSIQESAAAYPCGRLNWMTLYDIYRPNMNLPVQQAVWAVLADFIWLHLNLLSLPTFPFLDGIHLY